MALTDIEKIRLLIGDTPTSPFYPIFSDDEIQALLDMQSGNIRLASRMAAISASLQLAGYNSREMTGDIQVWNDISRTYLAALENLISDTSAASLPNGLMPYAAGISWKEVKANNDNPDNVRPELTKISITDAKGVYLF